MPRPGRRGPQEALTLLGLIAFRDPPRADSAAVVRELRELGVRVVMVTGDGRATARAVAAEVGITGPVCPPDRLHAGDPPLDYDVYAGVYPEDKFRLVESLQRSGRVAGMTGDGVNDAPALRQAELGVAVAGAVDVAKAAAGVVLTRPGLGGVADAVRVGRAVYQRMLTYTLNKIAKTVQISLLLAGGLVLTGNFVTTPRLILLLLFANDFVTMSLAADRVRPSPRPDRWDVRAITAVGFGAGVAWLLLVAAVFWAGRDLLGLALPQLQTLVFVALVYTGYANVFLVRERRRVWASAPGRPLGVAAGAGAVIVGLLAAGGVLVAPVPGWLMPALFGVVAGHLLLLDRLKAALVRRFGLGP